MIAEIKKASPARACCASASFLPSLRGAYETGGAACLSGAHGSFSHFQGAKRIYAEARAAAARR